MLTQAPYGHWQSPIKAEDVASHSDLISEPKISGGCFYWIEGRPDEGGRCQIVCRLPDSDPFDLLPEGYSAMSRVHEYGGGAYCVGSDHLYFVNQKDQQIYQIKLKKTRATPRALTQTPGCRYGDLQYNSRAHQLICICEDHRETVPVNSLVSISINSPQSIISLASGADFYGCPRLNLNTQQLAWVSWNHPNMPWDNNQLHTGYLAQDGSLASEKTLGTGESFQEPLWSPEGQLYCISDRSNWWNIYRYSDLDEALQPICSMEAEFSSPPWQLGGRHYAFINTDTLLATFTKNNRWYLTTIDVNSGDWRLLDSHYTTFGGLNAEAGTLVALAASATTSSEVIHYQDGQLASLTDSQNCLEADYTSIAEDIKVGSGDSSTYAFYYPPTNPNYEGPAGELPPLLVFSHGGPTGASNPALNLKIQYWTTRGFAIADVNYRGSSGYGRHYRNQLKGQWGIYDVEDCCQVATYLCDKGLVDPAKLVIRGGSAGGYTTLCALTFTNQFAAGCSLYGIGDLEILVKDTHKFESHYCNTLIAPYPEEKAIYRRRSPLHFSDQIQCPVLVLQGMEDKVVTPNQAETIVASLEAKGIPVCYISFPGEAHGFRSKEAIIKALHSEWLFYGLVLGFLPPSLTKDLPVTHLNNIKAI